MLSIEFLRAIAALMVVLMHIRETEKTFSANTVNNIPWFPDVLPGVDIFFVISGFVMVFAHRRQLNVSKHASQFLLKRILRIYPTYWQFTLLYLLIYLGDLGRFDASYIFNSFLLLPQTKHPLLSVGWTLVFEMYFYLVFCLVFFVPRWINAWLLVGWAFFLVLINGLNLVPEKPGAVVQLVTSPLAIEFILGCTIAGLLPKLKGQGALVCLLLSAAGYGIAFGQTEPNLLKVIYTAVSSALLVYGCVGLEYKGSRIFKNPIVHVGNASYSLYLSHVFVISAIGSTLILPNIATFIGFSALGVALSVGFALLNFRYIEAPLQKYLRKLLKANGETRSSGAP